MEVERGHARPVAARDATASGLLHEDPLYPAPAIRHPPLRAHDTSIGAPLVEPVDGGAVVWASAHDFPRGDCGIDPRQPRVAPCDLPAAKPVADSRHRTIEVGRDLSQWRALTGQLFQLLAVRGSPRRVLRHERMFA